MTAQKVVDKFPPHKYFIEPFAGRAAVFFKNKKATHSLLNDKNCRILHETRDHVCKLKDKTKCKKFKNAHVECGHDWTDYLKYDSPDTLFYLDPPFEGKRPKYTREMYGAEFYDGVKLKDIMDKTKNLMGTVVLSYNPDKEFSHSICHNNKYKCSKIKSFSFANWTNELFAIKKGSGNAK